MNRRVYRRKRTPMCVENRKIRWRKHLFDEVPLEGQSGGAVLPVPSGIGARRFGTITGERWPP